MFHREQPLAIVEAKKLVVGPQNVLQQALRYASGLRNSPFNFNGYHVPFVYSTNGELIYFQDLRQQNSRSRRVSKFHTPEALREMLERDGRTAYEWLRSNPVNHPLLRPYQCAAIESVEQALLQGKRRMLVAMAHRMDIGITI